MSALLSALLGGSGGVPIGASMLSQPGQNLMTLGDGSVWLRAGVLAAASLYPAAAQLTFLGAHGFTSRAAGAGVGSTQRRLATDGNGRYMLTDGDNSWVRMSNDRGKTWSNVAHGLGVPATDIIFADGRWVVVGNSVSYAFCNTSTNGTSFGAAVTLAGVLTSGVANTAQIAHSGALYYVAVAADTPLWLWSSPTAASGTWTNRSNSASTSSNMFGLGAGGGRAVVTIAAAPNVQTVVDGSAAVDRNTGFSFGVSGQRAAYQNGMFVFWTSNTTFGTSTDLTTFTPQTQSALSAVQVNPLQWFQANGRLSYAAANSFLGLLSTADGINFDYQSTSVDLSANTLAAIAGDAVSLVHAPTGSASVWQADSAFAAPNRVGRALQSYANSSQMVNPALYYKVK